MPATLTYPGVYVDEVPTGGARPIAAVPTSIAAFVGPVPQGPTTVTDVTSLDDFERVYGKVRSDNPLGIAVYQFFLNGGAQAKVVRVVAVGNGNGNGGGGGGGGAAAAGAAPATITLGAEAGAPKLTASSVGEWGNKLRARVDANKDDFDPSVPEQDRGTLYNLTVYDAGNRRTERFTSIDSKAGGRKSLGDAIAGSKLVVLADPKTDAGTATPKPNPEPKKTGANPFDPSTEPSDPPPANGGNGGGAGGAQPTPPPLYYEGKGGSNGAANAPIDWDSAYAALRKLPDTFNILCLLPKAHGEQIAGAPLTEAGKLCLDRRAFLLVDAPTEWRDIQAAVDGILQHELIGTDFAKSAAIYFPRLRIANPNPMGNPVIEDVAPSGAVAGLYARTDFQRGVWKAPAGTAAGLAGVASFTVPMTDPENGRLNPLGVNCLRAFPGLGRLSWGTRTMAGADTELDDPSWRYVPIRRLALFIEESLYRGTKWVVFEPNDEPLWASIRLSVGAFMNVLFRQGAFQGRTPKEAYLVKCDKDNNPQEDIDRGIVNILVGFAPLKPAEFVLLHIQQLPGDVQS